MSRSKSAFIAPLGQPSPSYGRASAGRATLSAFIALLAFCLSPALHATKTRDPAAAIREDALASHVGYELLGDLCDRFGGRLAGSPEAAAAREALADRLRAEGLSPKFERFTMPAWKRGDDLVEMLSPVARPIRATALGYTTPHPAFEAPVVDVGTGTAEDFAAVEQPGAMGLIAFRAAVPKSELHESARAHGLRGMLQINREGGGQLLARSGSLQGEPLPIPVYSITQEEGLWMQRLLQKGAAVRVRVTTNSQPFEAEVANLSVRFPGRSGAKIVLAGHFDSWDLGQGAMDNGLGVAQLFEVARLVAKHSPENHHAIEIVWLDGEELGLWGSRERARRDADADMVAMINLDMVGWPKSVNAMGHDDLVSWLEAFDTSLPDELLPDGVVNQAWMASDHTPYALTGVRTITFGAPIPRESVRYYHDLADTMDKVDPDMLSEASAVVASLVVRLANDETLTAVRLEPGEVAAILRHAKLEERLRDSGLWNFPD